jgi:hypothetical protein
MILEDLVGPHELSGVDYGIIPRSADSHLYEDSGTLTFVLDNKAYCAIEDPSDGYRSCMQDIVEVPVDRVKNRFTPVPVMATHLTKKRGDCDILVLTDLNATVVYLEVGTDNTDDYYPSFVWYFDPKTLTAAAEQPKTRLSDWVRDKRQWKNLCAFSSRVIETGRTK